MEAANINYTNQVGLRRDILSFDQSDPRRKRFFFCLKMLDILPAHQENRNNVFYTGGRFEPNSFTKPQRIHDQLIASHATSCEHHTQFFGYYHRHILVYTEMQLNYADQYLRLEDWSKQQPNAKQWKKVMDQYHLILQELKQKKIFQQKVYMHYWNPTNYQISSNKNSNFYYPSELLPKHNLQSIDILYEKVNSHLPWNLNLRTRFYQVSQEKYKDKNPENDFYSFFQTRYRQNDYNQNQKLILSGKAHPRAEDPQLVKVFFSNFDTMYWAISDQISKKNKEYFYNQGKGEIVPIFNLNNQELNTRFNLKVNNQHWIHPSEAKKAAEKMGGFTTPGNILLYNDTLPHYQFARAYYKSGGDLIGAYLRQDTTTSQKQLQQSHDAMHTRTGYIMGDGNLSITNLIFLLYHSWIDYQLQVKIRQLFDFTSYQTAVNKINRVRPKTAYDVFNKESGSYTIGSYKLVEWADPRVGSYRWAKSNVQIQQAENYFKTLQIDRKNAIKYCFKETNFQKFVLNIAEKHIRRTDELQQIYKKQYEIDHPLNKRFSYFKNLKNYNFNYNYEIYDQGRRIVMDQPNIPILPSYITKIIEEALYFRGAKTDILPRFIMGQQGQNVSEPSLPVRIKQKILQNSILALAKYPSSIQSGVYAISIQFLSREFEQFNKNSDQKDFQYIKSGFKLYYKSIFSKGQGSKTCPKCYDTKNFWICISNKLREAFPQIWKALNIYFLENNRIAYGSIEQKSKAKANQVIKLRSDTQFIQDFTIIAGAEEAQFDVVLLSKEFNEQVIVKLELESHSIINNKIQGIVSKTLYSLQEKTSQKHFDFYRITDLAASSSQNNLAYFDKYCYQLVKGQVQCGTQTKQFSFKIPNYHRLIRYLVTVSIGKSNEQSEGITVLVQDKDYQIKKNYYESWQDQMDFL